MWLDSQGCKAEDNIIQSGLLYKVQWGCIVFWEVQNLGTKFKGRSRENLDSCWWGFDTTENTKIPREKEVKCRLKGLKNRFQKKEKLN